MGLIDRRGFDNRWQFDVARTNEDRWQEASSEKEAHLCVADDLAQVRLDGSATGAGILARTETESFEERQHLFETKVRAARPYLGRDIVLREVDSDLPLAGLERVKGSLVRIDGLGRRPIGMLVQEVEPVGDTIRCSGIAGIKILGICSLTEIEVDLDRSASSTVVIKTHSA
ncbi:MAG: hypothetical protein OXU45_09815 [Candidatus Melainabacteria bacterium]|nr:hypothetical protein [Candidatus Melainabacteria bacterium]